MSTDGYALPSVVARPGDLLADVQSKSSLAIDLSRTMDFDMTPVSGRCVFVFDGPGHFILPTTKLIILESEATIVESIFVAPQEDSVDEEKALVLLDSIVGLILASGWAANKARAISRSELRSYLRDPAVPDQASWVVQGFSSGNVVLDLSLKRLARATSLPRLLGGAPDEFLVNVELTDSVVSDEAGKIAQALRTEDGIAKTVAVRPVDLSSYTARVRSLLAKEGGSSRN